MIRSRPILLLVLMGALALGPACVRKKITANPPAAPPAVNGSAVLSEDSSGKTVIQLKVQHLARPQDLSPSKTAYVVWIQPPGGAAVNQGKLQVSRDLEAEFRAPTALKNFDIFVTAEDNPEASQPTGQEVLRQTVKST